MHVHNHFRHFALQPKTAGQARAARKKGADTENIERVESRFSEDEEQENPGQRRGRQDQAVHPWDGAGTQEQPISPAIGPSQRSSNGATPAVHVESVPVTSPLDLVLASLMNAAPRAAGSAVEKNHDVAAEASLEDLLALMRTAPPES